MKEMGFNQALGGGGGGGEPNRFPGRDSSQGE